MLCLQIVCDYLREDQEDLVDVAAQLGRDLQKRYLVVLRSLSSIFLSHFPLSL